MIISTLIAASAAAAQPQATPQPAPHADHKAMQHNETQMACCEKMAKRDGCDCCKGMDGKAAGPAKDGHGAHQH